MKSDGGRMDPELEAFVRPRWYSRRTRAELRERGLARARAILASRGEPVDVPAPPAARSVWRRWAPIRIAVAASLIVAMGAIGAAAALALHGSFGFGKHDHASPTIEPPIPARPEALVRGSIGKPAPAPSIAPVDAGQRVSPDVTREELGLLLRAHAAYEHRDFSRALALVLEHARRFPHGPLAEEREALRVQSLSASGRPADAQRAAAAFRAQFPRSSLLRPPVGPDSSESK